MKYLDLISMLSDNFKLSPSSSINDIDVKEVLLIDHTLQQWNKHTIYIWKNSIHPVKVPDFPIMLLCVTTPKILPTGSLYSIIQENEIGDIYTFIKDLLYQEAQAKASLFELANQALEEKNIVSLINTASELLGSALILVSSNQKILSYPTVYEIKDPLWLKNIQSGYCSYDFTQKVRSNQQMKEWNKQSGEVQVITLDGDLQPKLVARITKDNHVIGSLVMIGHHTNINKNHYIQLPAVGKILFDFLQLHSLENIHHSIYSDILFQLLDEINTAETFELAAISKADFPKEMCVIVCRFVQRVENRYLKQTIQIELERIFPGGHTVKYKNYIAILVPSIEKHQESKLESLAQGEDLSIGISWPFYDILEFKKHFNQAIASIKLGQLFEREKQVVHYIDFSHYDLLNNYTGKVPLDTFCHPALKILENYDVHNNAELYITLRHYLENNQKLTTTADTLYIHKNSLAYRIKRIKELTGINLDDVSTIYSLIYSYTIDDFLRAIRPKDSPS